MNFPRTSELSTEILDDQAVWLPAGVPQGLALGRCSTCHQWVAETLSVDRETLGHRLVCSQPRLALGIPLRGWRVNPAPPIDHAMARLLVGLQVHVLKLAGGAIMVASDADQWGHWDVAEALMRLGFVPPLTLVQTLEVVPKGERHPARHLWVMKGARRATRIALERATAEAKRIFEVRRKMFRLTDEEEQGEDDQGPAMKLDL